MIVNNPRTTSEFVFEYIEKNKFYKFHSPTREPYFNILKKYGHRINGICTKPLLESLEIHMLNKLYNELNQLNKDYATFTPR